MIILGGIDNFFFFLIFQLWVAYAPCGAQHKDAVQVTLEQIDLIKRMIEAYPTHVQLVKTSTGKNHIYYVRIIIILRDIVFDSKAYL